MSFFEFAWKDFSTQPALNNDTAVYIYVEVTSHGVFSPLLA
jgi:hypothetical protein